MLGKEERRKRYAEEAYERWGDTDAFRESARRTADYTADDWNALSDGMDAVMKGFAALKASGASPEGEPARRQVERLRAFITQRLYPCTDAILAGLGQMYGSDPRFTKHIDRHGEGTAAFVAACIERYSASQDTEPA